MFQLSPSPIHPVPRGDLCHLGLGCGWVVGLGRGWALTTTCATAYLNNAHGPLIRLGPARVERTSGWKMCNASCPGGA